MDLQPAHELLQQACRRGATAADVLMVDNVVLDVQVRLGTVEKLQQARRQRLGLRLFFGQRSAVTATSDFSLASLSQLLEDTCALAQAMAADPCAGLPDPEVLSATVPDLDLWDEALAGMTVEDGITMAREAEQAALDFDPCITNSEGGTFSTTQAHVAYLNSYGFVGQYRACSAYLSVVPVASSHGSMQRDSWYTAARKRAHLQAPVAVGQEAARRALRRLEARKVATQKVPVVFDPRTASSLLGHVCAAVSGAALYRRASFLLDQLDETIAPEGFTVIDDGTLPAALGSKPFDGEGVPTRRTTVVAAGVLRSYLLDTYSARKLGLQSTGNAVRSAGEAPQVGPTNFYLMPGPYTPEEIIASVPRGLYVTELLGFGVNLVTGDYSRGAAGLWIENGTLTHAVEEITIAGNLRQILADVEMIGNDLDWRRKVTAPTLKVRTMMLAGA